MEDIFEKVKDNVRIADVVGAFGIKLDRNGKGLCPFHHEKTPSFSVDKANNIFTCFGCGETGDVITFAQKMKNCTPYEAASFLAEMYHIDITERVASPKKEISSYLKRCMADVGKTDYFKKRGLTDETIKKFCLGYDVDKRVVTIPYSSKLQYYQTRSVEDKRFFKPRTEDAGAEPIYCEELLNVAAKELCFVVESPICAMSIMQESNQRAVAICGVGNYKKLVEKLKEIKPKGIIVLSLDRDDAGYETREKILKALKDSKINVIDGTVAGWKKDPNEMLLTDKPEFIKQIEIASRRASIEFSSINGLCSAKDLFHKYVPPIRWFVQDMLPTGLTLLVAAPKVGKSYMVLQLCLAITNGEDFLLRKTEKVGAVYFALEDEDEVLKPRMVKMNKEREPSEDFFYTYDAKRTDTGFYEQLDDIMRIYPKVKVFVVDTLQYIRAPAKSSRSVYAVDHEEMKGLHKFASSRKISIVLIHHNRKMKDDGDSFNEISGSQALLGGVDMAWYLTKKKRSDQRATLKTASRKCKDIEEVLERDADARWVVVADEDSSELTKWRKEYEDSELVQFITEMLKRNPMGYMATCQGISTEFVGVMGHSLPLSNERIGKAIENFESRFLEHGIVHTKERGRKHCFRPKPQYYGPIGYQQVIDD